MDQTTCLKMDLIKKVEGGIQLKPHREAQESLQTHATPPITISSFAEVATSSDLAILQQLSGRMDKMEQQMDDLHFKMDATMAFLGCTLPHRPRFRGVLSFPRILVHCFFRWYWVMWWLFVEDKEHAKLGCVFILARTLLSYVVV